MRPVEKKKPGDIVRYTDSNNQEIEHIIQENYPDYGDAKFPLASNIGQYCSYCEGYEKIHSLEVEHMAAKAKGGSRTAWNNFLLCCKICNTVKGVEVINDDFHWPHLNNTFYSFVYDETGRVKVNDSIPALSQVRAQKLLDLTGLHRYPGDANGPTPKDFRWKYRYEAWKLATDWKLKFLDRLITEDDIISRVKDKGQWSIWFTVFKGIDSVRARLISDFPGTCASCFDANNHYEPIERNPGTPDPI
jgi:5-methylcytosine-specific restriction endonuclease McrA